MTSRDPRVDDLRRQVRDIRRARRSSDPARAPGGFELPDIVEWVLSDRYLNQTHLYPRQATLLRLIFLQDSEFTAFDRSTLDEWMSGFALPDQPPPAGSNLTYRYHGRYGIPPDSLDRLRINKESDRFSFREIVGPVGRRGGKGHVGAVAGSYILGRLLALGDVHKYFEIPPGKVISVSVFGGNQALAQANQWLDFVR